MKDFLKAIFAGIMIGIAGIIYISVEPKYIGAILFSIGLIIICIREYNLYTGKIGYITSIKDLPRMFLYILGNVIGVFLISQCTTVSSVDLVESKLALPHYLVLLKAIGCGFLMYLAVDIFKQQSKLIGIIGCVPAFILAGFEHSIADILYIFRSGIYNWNALIFIIIVIIGNAIGALLHKLIKE